MDNRKPLFFEEFKMHLAGLLQITPENLTRETNLVLDLGLDSLKLLQIVLEFERLGVSTNLKEAWGIQTVGEAFDYYQRAIGILNQDEG